MAKLTRDDRFLDHEVPEGHVERPARLEAVRDLLEDQGWADRLERVAPEPVDPEIVDRVHDDAMVERTRRTCREGGGWLDPDTAVGPTSWEVAELSAGAVVRTVEQVACGETDRAFALSRPPGHHATPSKAMGFCLLSNVAIAARSVLDDGLAERVAILDHDVHHGNGTQAVLDDEPDALYVSIHQSPLYPGTGAVDEVGVGPGEGTVVNVPVPAGFADDAYLELVDRIVVPVAEAFDPELWIVSAGFDGHRRDPLAGLDLSSGAFPAILDRIAEVTDRIAWALEGGYDLQGLARGVVGQLAWAVGGRVPWDESPSTGGDADAVVAEVREAQRAYWDL